MDQRNEAVLKPPAIAELWNFDGSTTVEGFKTPSAVQIFTTNQNQRFKLFLSQPTKEASSRNHRPSISPHPTRILTAASR